MDSLKKYINTLNEQVKYASGVYISVNLTSESKEKLNAYYNAYLSEYMQNSSLHCTLIYSAKPHNTSPVLERYKTPGLFEKFSKFGPDGDTLVLEIKCPKLTRRNAILTKENGFISDWEYHPHVTIAYEYNGDISKLPPIDFPIYFENETLENLNPEWK